MTHSPAGPNAPDPGPRETAHLGHGAPRTQALDTQAVDTQALGTQPLGIFPPPTAYLLVPPDPALDEARAALMAGRWPEQLPNALAYYRLAFDGDIEGALAALAAPESPESPESPKSPESHVSAGMSELITGYNRFVLQPNRPAYERLRAAVADARRVGRTASERAEGLVGPQAAGSEAQPVDNSTDEHAGRPADWPVNGPADELAEILAVVGYIYGYADTPPAPGAARAERLAFVWMAQAIAALERPDLASARQLLQAAHAASARTAPALAAQVLGELAAVEQAMEGPQVTQVAHFQAAIHLLRDTALDQPRATLQLRLASLYHALAEGRRGVLFEAARFYQDAIETFSLERVPERYAAAQAGLAAVWLDMPRTDPGDHLWLSAAAHALREVLKVYTPDTHPAECAAAAGALAEVLAEIVAATERPAVEAAEAPSA